MITTYNVEDNWTQMEVLFWMSAFFSLRIHSWPLFFLFLTERVRYDLIYFIHPRNSNDTECVKVSTCVMVVV